MLYLLAAIFMGWSLGANDAANAFGTAVSARMVSWRKAALLTAAGVLAGALLGGRGGLATLGALQEQSLNTAFAASLAAALTVTLMTLLSIPVSASQAVVGGIMGIGLANGAPSFNGLGKIVACWIGTPLGAMLACMLLLPFFTRLFRALNLHFLVYDGVMRLLLILSGIYGAYALGANNVANVTGVFYQAGAFGDDPAVAAHLALLIGAGAIAFGALTFSKKVMLTVGEKIVKLDSFTAFVVVLSQALTVHIYAGIGVPVSTSQAVIGAVVGVGLLKGIRTISGKTLLAVLAGWVLTPVMGLGFGYGICRLFL